MMISWIRGFLSLGPGFMSGKMMNPHRIFHIALLSWWARWYPMLKHPWSK